ncbi:tyrosine-protein phosphatase non-receptor type 18 [Corythoichthys intestinalis]|uniref:tyrosine-protein phosphatase non-receptor type 18 n=1 Tax=Corythoichthys intestinalis TaxID=161448 RepID=UPI0025A4F4A9|nr:tyrosine-protein phosphatase non-receptor type 18 [Corythoichthys intestinalis]
MYKVTSPKKEEAILPLSKSDRWKEIHLTFNLYNANGEYSQLTVSGIMSNVTYAVVNKPKQKYPPSENRTSYGSHHYDNDPLVTTLPLYSMVGPSEGAWSSAGLAELSSGASLESVSGTHNDYEEVSTSVTEISNKSVRDSLEYNYRVQKPRGPRPPPPAWT